MTRSTDPEDAAGAEQGRQDHNRELMPAHDLPRLEDDVMAAMMAVFERAGTRRRTAAAQARLLKDRDVDSGPSPKEAT